MIKSICIVRLSALGDVLMLVPLVRTLQSNFKDVHLTWVISPPAYDLVKGIDGVEFIVINKPKRVGDYWQFWQQLKHRRFDVLLAAQASLRANLLYPLIRAPRKIGYDRLRAKDGHQWFVNETIDSGHDHTLDGFLRFAQALGIQQTDIRWDLPLALDDKAWAKQQLATDAPVTVLINPAASKAERSWLPQRYAQIIKHLQTQFQAYVVLVGGPGPIDKALGEAIGEYVPVCNLIGKTKLTQLMALIDHADLLICPDTGPSHMGTSVSTPVVALHAVTSANVSGPYLYQHLAVDFYPEAVQKILHKSLEENIWGTHAHGNETMALISVEAVIERLNEVIPKLNPSFVGKDAHINIP